MIVAVTDFSAWRGAARTLLAAAVPPPDIRFDDGTASWWLGPDGWVKKTTDAEGRPLLDMQSHLIAVMSQRRGQV